MRRHRPVLALAASLLTALAAACGGAGTESLDTSEGQLTEAEFTRPWDFVYVYPEAETVAHRDAMLSLTDLGFDQKFFDAAYGHMSGKFKLPGASTDDAPVSPDDPTIIHEDCLREMKSWRVTQVRFAPYEMAVPGTVSAYRTWAEGRSRGSRLDRTISVRISVHPICPLDFDPKQVGREDQAMHLVYNVMPNDAGLAGKVYGAAKEFTEAQLLGTTASRTSSYAALEAHRVALESAPWLAFRKEVLVDWAKLARTSSLPDSAFAAYESEAASFRSVGVSKFSDRFANGEPTTAGPSFGHPGLADPNGAMRLGLRDLLKKYARPERLFRAALMFTVGTQDVLDDFQETRWFFSQIKPGRYDKLGQMPTNAADVYGSHSPAPLDTFVAIGHARGVDVVRATSAGFYAESRGAFTGPKAVYPARITLNGKSVELKREVDKVDYEQAVVLDSDEGHDMPKLPRGTALKSAMDRFANVEVTNASTTGCDRCHNTMNFMRTDSAKGWRPSERQESAYNFHMITTGGLSMRTVRELDSELAQARAEMRRP